MTTLYYIPDKDRKAFIAPANFDTSLMDVAIVDTAGLVCYVEETLGLHCDDKAFNKRLCRYYKLLRKWLDFHSENVLSKSFNLAHLSTARQMLLWRDELKMAQWDFQYDDDSTRLGALSAVERIECVAGLPDRIINVVNLLASAELNKFIGLRIVLNVERGILRPLLRKLLDALELRGAAIEVSQYAEIKQNNLSDIRKLLLSDKNEKITLNPDDRSFEVLSFDTAYDESEYIGVCQNEFDTTLFINPKSKETDNRLAAQNLPTVGSLITSRSRILNLMPLALSLYDDYLQITKLVEWFTAPVHPLPGRFRFQLAEAIARSGGFINKDCREIVDKYINGEYAYPDERDKELSPKELGKVKAKRRNEREDNVSLFVPYLMPDYQRAENAERTLKQLATWARQRIHSLTDDDNREALSIQLGSLAESIDILMLLFNERDEKFDLSLANEWVRDIPAEITLPQHPARVGAIFTVSKPWDIVSATSRIVWTNMENEDIPDFECEFLLPGERDAISSKAEFWNREDETRYRFLNSIMPFLFATESIVLTCADKRNSEKIVPHPVITRLQVQISNFKAFVRRPDISDKRSIKVKTVDNNIHSSELKFDNADKIALPSRMSATGLETFVVYPFDFLFERILNYQTAGLSSLPELHTTKGNVAHATIASLFAPLTDADCCQASEIRKRVEANFEEALKIAINECGAILMLPENKLERNNLSYELKKCIDTLLDIIDENELTVNGCEKHYSKFVNLNSDEFSDNAEDDLHGYIDMKLTDTQGHHVVFDLKWTGSRSYHQSLLEKNRSTQLAVYSELLSGEKAVKTAYFVMPRGRLISCSYFKGRDVVNVDRENADDIMAQLVNSYRYRRNQLAQGILENGEGHPLSELTYETDRECFNLFPLPGDYEDSEVKAANRFSNYHLFKGL